LLILRDIKLHKSKIISIGARPRKYQFFIKTAMFY
jgi:hypothetical protein